MPDLNQQLRRLKIVPVVKLARSADALPLADALCAGGLPVAEITFRTDAAEDSIRRIRAAYPDMLVGAGTVLTVAQAERALAAGSAFIVSPGTSRPVIEFCLSNGVPVFPGCCTPTELMVLAEYGLTVAKFFPASDFGGLATIKSLAAVFGGVDFMPTGGIGPHNLTEYLAFPRIVACGGSWMVRPDAIEAGQFDQIQSATAATVALATTTGPAADRATMSTVRM